MTKKLAFVLLFMFLLSSCSTVKTDAEIPNAEFSQTKETEKPENIISAFNPDKYLSENGYSLHYADALNPIKWLFTDRERVTELTAAGEVVTAKTVYKSQIAGLDKTDAGLFVTVTLHDVSGQKVSVNLSRADLEKLEAEIK